MPSRSSRAARRVGPARTCPPLSRRRCGATSPDLPPAAHRTTSRSAMTSTYPALAHWTTRQADARPARRRSSLRAARRPYSSSSGGSAARISPPRMARFLAKCARCGALWAGSSDVQNAWPASVVGTREAARTPAAARGALPNANSVGATERVVGDLGPRLWAPQHVDAGDEKQCGDDAAAQRPEHAHRTHDPLAARRPLRPPTCPRVGVAA
jgi:hypothetical protein